MIFVISMVYADEIQFKLMSIAAQEASIANIGTNKYMMLYGINNPISVINQWNLMQKRPNLTNEQIQGINSLEIEKQWLLKQVSK